MSDSIINDGGPAFPHGLIVEGVHVLQEHPGQSYRADVAKLVLAALCSNPQGPRSMHSQVKYDVMAEEALKHTDALIRRLKGGSK